MTAGSKPGIIKDDDNRISFIGSLPPAQMRKFCAALHGVIEKKGFDDVTLDFSRCDAAFESAILPLLPLLANYRKNRVTFSLILPQDDRIGRLFKNTNWAHYIDPKEFDMTHYEGGHVPATQFHDSGEIYKIVNKVIDLVLGSLPELGRGHEVLEWSLNEIMDNVLNHAESKVGGFVQSTSYSERNQVEFVVADAGIGIPKSLGMPHNQTDAVRKAIDAGATRDKTKGAGNGLFGSYRVATFSEGAFEINSMNAFLLRSGHEGVKVENLNIPYTGTSVRCRIGFGDPEALAKALEFNGKPHDPATSYVERHYGDDKGNMIFQMHEHKSHFGSRAGGKRVHTFLQNLLAQSNRLIIDFDGVSVISSSFADEVFGRLFVAMGPTAFNNRLEITHADPTVRGLIDRAIVQRTQLDNDFTKEG